MTYPLEVDTPYVSTGEWILGLTIATFLWCWAYHGLRHTAHYLFKRDGYCLQFLADVYICVLALVDMLAIFYVMRSDDGKRENYQVALGLTFTSRALASLPARAFISGYAVFALVGFWIIWAVMTAACAMMYVATDPWYNVGPYLGLVVPILYLLLTIGATIWYTNCCQTCSYTSYRERSRDYVAHRDSTGAFAKNERARAQADDDETADDLRSSRRSQSRSSRGTNGYSGRERS